MGLFTELSGRVLGLASNEIDRLSSLRIPKRAHPLRGWTNLGLYEIHGKNPATGRMNKRTHECLTEADARSWALSEGLAEPVAIKEIQRRMASDEQIRVCRKMGIKAKFEELSAIDASALIWFRDDHEFRKINITEWAAACQAGYAVSALCGPKYYKYIMENGGEWRYREE